MIRDMDKEEDTEKAMARNRIDGRRNNSSKRKKGKEDVYPGH